LVSTGALNPVTLAHVAMFEMAKDGLEAEFGFEVVGGFLSPSHDRYLEWKNPLGESLSAEQRLEMCVAATQKHELLSVGRWESSVVGHWPDFDEVTWALMDALKHRFSADAPEVLYLCGADHFPNTRGRDLPGVCVVDRGGQTGVTDEARNIYAIASDPDDRYREMSSTRVRKALSDDDVETLGALPCIPTSLRCCALFDVTCPGGLDARLIKLVTVRCVRRIRRRRVMRRGNFGRILRRRSRGNPNHRIASAP